MKNILLAIMFLFLGAAVVFAQEKVNEDSMFSDPGSVIDTSTVKDDSVFEPQKKSLGFSGSAVGAMQFFGTRDWLHNGINAGNKLMSSVIADFYIDARLKKDMKYFGNIEVVNDSKSKQTNISFKESFIDVNSENAVYFRAGKQVLQWGRCYLWNPTDMINIEKKTFITKLNAREGTFGLKAHAPLSAMQNVYGFWDMHDADKIDKTAFAGKYEFVIGKTEMAFSVWGKQGLNTVYGYDLSTRLFGIDMVGEAAVSYGDNVRRLRVIQAPGQEILSAYNLENEWIPRVSLDFGKSFDFMEVLDRIQVNVEFFYNEGGYEENIFSDKKNYLFSQPVAMLDTAGNPIVMTNGTKKDLLLGGNLYEPNYYSKYYGALFATFNKFILSDMSLSMNLIGNLNDKSAIATTGLSYKTLNDLSLGLTVYYYLGKSNAEYTFASNALGVQATVGVLF